MDPRTLAVVLISASVATAGAALPPLGDAGTGGDAGDSPDEATELSGAGTYHGTLFPPGDADWYRLPTTPSQALCSQAIVDGAAHASVTLSATPGLNPAVTRPVEPGYSLDLGLSTPSTTGVFLGLEPSEDLSADETSVGSYRFNLTTLQPSNAGPGDAGTGEDAGENRSTGVHTEGPCIGGSLDDPTDSDVYVFNAAEGEHVAVSLSQATSAPTFVNLTSPSGKLVAQIDAGGFQDVVLNETGEWIVRADLPHETTATGGDYLIGTTVNGPEPQPCKPGCFMVGG